MAQRTQGLSVLTIFQHKKKVELLKFNQTFTKGQAVILNLSWSPDYLIKEYEHTSYLSILVHHHTIKACKK